MIALCSKTYYCFGSADKYSTKGLNKRQNEINKGAFLDVLTGRQNGRGWHMGFQVKDSTVLTYVQERAALTYFYRSAACSTMESARRLFSSKPTYYRSYVRQDTISLLSCVKLFVIHSIKIVAKQHQDAFSCFVLFCMHEYTNVLFKETHLYFIL